MRQRTAQPIKLGDNELVAGAVGRKHHRVQLKAAGQLARRLIQEDLITSRRGEPIALSLGVLVAGADPSVADRIANPRQRDVGADAASVTGPSRGNARPAWLSRERSLPGRGIAGDVFVPTAVQKSGTYADQQGIGKTLSKRVKPRP